LDSYFTVPADCTAVNLNVLLKDDANDGYGYFGATEVSNENNGVGMVMVLSKNHHYVFRCRLATGNVIKVQMIPAPTTWQRIWVWVSEWYFD